MIHDLEIFSEDEYVSFISKRIQKIQFELNKSNIEMANILEVTESTYNRYISSDVKVPAFRCMRLCLAKNIDANYLFGSNPDGKMFINKEESHADLEYDLLNLKSRIEIEKRFMSDKDRIRYAYRLFEIGLELNK